MSNLLLDFKVFFESIKRLPYCVIKLDPYFPSYKKGQDIDILCRDIHEMSSYVLSFLSSYIKNQDSIEVNKLKKSIHIDLICDDTIHFRFDLIQELYGYKSLSLKKSFTDVVIESSMEKNVKDFIIRVPNQVDDSILRYIEYIEYISERPDKIKHVHHILSRLKNNSINENLFYDRFHHFVSIPLKPMNQNTINSNLYRNFIYISERISNAFRIIKKYGFIGFLSRLKNKIF